MDVIVPCVVGVACLAVGFLAGAFYASWAISGRNWSDDE